MSRSLELLRNAGARKFVCFISSTKQGLNSHRERIFATILDQGHFPLGMENFDDNYAWNSIVSKIEKQISSCDLFVLFIAGKYGSEVAGRSDGVSYTELEFEIATRLSQSSRLDLLVFYLSDEALQNLDPALKEKRGSAALRKLNAFREKATRQGNFANQCDNLDHMVERFASAFAHWVNHPRGERELGRGWVSASFYLALKKEYLRSQLHWVLLGATSGAGESFSVDRTIRALAERLATIDDVRDYIVDLLEAFLIDLPRSISACCAFRLAREGEDLEASSRYKIFLDSDPHEPSHVVNHSSAVHHVYVDPRAPYQYIPDIAYAKAQNLHNQFRPGEQCLLTVRISYAGSAILVMAFRGSHVQELEPYLRAMKNVVREAEFAVGRYVDTMTAGPTAATNGQSIHDVVALTRAHINERFRDVPTQPINPFRVDGLT